MDNENEVVGLMLTILINSMVITKKNSQKKKKKMMIAGSVIKVFTIFIFLWRLVRCCYCYHFKLINNYSLYN